MPTATWLNRGDWISVLERAYARSDDDAQWGRDLVSAAEPLLEGATFGFHVTRHNPGFSDIRILFAQSPHGLPEAEVLFQRFGKDAPRAYPAFAYKAGIANTAAAVERLFLPADLANLNHNFCREFGFEDALGIVVHPQPGVVGMFYWCAQDRLHLPLAARARVARFAMHLETALRLRLNPESVVGVVDAAGRVSYREPAFAPSTHFESHLDGIERARTRHGRSDPAALELWKALHDGLFSLVERGESSEREYLVVQNPLHARASKAFTKRESDIITLAARGLPSKLVAYTLGISAASVSRHLATAAGKVSLLTRIELVRLAAQLTRSPLADQTTEDLTQAEQEVGQLVLRGLSNQQIAELRGRSLRTIANQVAELLRKTRSPGRKAFSTQWRRAL